MLKINIFIEMNNSNEAVNAISPDIYNLSIPLNNQCIISDEKIKNFIKSEIEKELQDLINNGELLEKPCSAKEVEGMFAEKNGVCIEIEVDNYPCKIKFFEKSLPGVGNLCAVVCLLCNSLLALMALMLTSSNGLIMGAGISAAFVAFLVTLIMYMFSGAGESLANVGRLIDNLIFKNADGLCNETRIAKEYGNSASCSMAKVLTSIGAGTLVASNIAIAGIRTYQEANVLGEAFIAKNSYITSDMIHLLSATLLVSSTVTNVAYQGTFAKQAVNYLTEKMDYKKDSDTYKNDNAKRISLKSPGVV